jgi:hypothetical protein
MNILNFITRLSITLLILIAIEGMSTLGNAFALETYTWLGCTVQLALITICVRISASKWSNENPNHI